MALTWAEFFEKQRGLIPGALEGNPRFDKRPNSFPDRNGRPAKYDLDGKLVDSALRPRWMDQMDDKYGTLPTPLGGGLMHPVDTGNRPVDLSGAFTPNVQAPTQQPVAAAPQQVTAHTESPWGASISDFFNNDNWTRQYEGINPRSGEPISVGNWYTPGGASAAPVNTAPAAAGGSAINNDPLVQELAEKFRNDEWRGRGPQTIFPVDPVDTQFDPTPLHVDQGQDTTPAEKPPWWNQVGEFLGTTWEGAKDYVPDLAISKPIVSTLPHETRATEALKYKYLPAATQQLLFMQNAGIGRKYPVDYRELGIRRNDLSRLMRRGGDPVA